MKQFRVREGDITAVDTKTQLTTVGSDTAPGPLQVPKDAKFITAIKVVCAENFAAATSFSAFLRLEGAGMANGPEALPVMAGGVPVATGGNGTNRAVRIPINFEVVEGNEIQIFGEMAGTDVGGIGMAVELEFSDKAGGDGKTNKTLLVEGDISAVDTRTALTTQGSVSSPSLLIPAGYTEISKFIYAAAAEGLADGKATFLARLGGNAVQRGEQVKVLSAGGRIAPQSGSDSAPSVCMAQVDEDCGIEVNPSDTISVWAEMAGDDLGTGRVVLGLVLAK